MARVAKGIPIGVAKTAGAAAGAVLKSAGETVIDQATLPKRVTESVLTGKELKEITEAKAAVNVVGEVSTDVRKDGIPKYIQKQGEAYLDAVNKEIMAYDDPLQGVGEEVLGPIAFEIIAGVAMNAVASKFMGKHTGATKGDADTPNRRRKNDLDIDKPPEDTLLNTDERRTKHDNTEIPKRTGEETKGNGVEINEVYEADDVEWDIDGIRQAKFQYRHNPSDSPKVLLDAIEDTNAVYGYKPNDTGSLKKFVKYDWTNPDVVAKLRDNRILYHMENNGYKELVNSMRIEGYSDIEIAKTLVKKRNANRLSSYINEDGKISDIELYNQAKEHCVSYEELKHGINGKPGKSDLQIIESAMKGNEGMDACCGLYDDYYHTYK